MKGILIVGFVMAAAAVHADQGPLDAAKDLYASAAYEEALSTLTRIDRSATPDDGREVDQYRAFCLYALGRTAEAEGLVESLIRKEPLLQLDGGGASPRIEALFDGVRKRLLPGLIREQYRTARAALDKNPSEAEPHLTAAHQMLAEARKVGAWDDDLADLQVLVDGFLDLAHATAVRPPQMVAETHPVVTPPAPTPPPAAGPTQPAQAPRVFSESDSDVSPPVAIRQSNPTVPPELFRIIQQYSLGGRLEILIDETGAVQRAVVHEGVNSAYDQFVVNAARSWKFRPAMKDGVPVKYTKMLNIAIERP